VTAAGGAPIAAFTVRVGERATSFASGDGRYRIENLEPGAHTVEIVADDHAPAELRVDVPPGGVADGSATLPTGATVEGRVRDADGAPVPGASVSMFSGGGDDEAFTDADGRFRLDRVAPGRRSLSVEATGFTGRQETLELAPGERRTVEVTLSPLAGAARAVEFAGIGATLSIEEQRVLLGALVAGGPAEGAGLAPGDELVAVDGTPCAGRTLRAVTEDIRGVAGTTVRLDVRRGAETFTLDVVRRTVRWTG
jgi:hypothetical protein